MRRRRRRRRRIVTGGGNKNATRRVFGPGRRVASVRECVRRRQQRRESVFSSASSADVPPQLSRFALGRVPFPHRRPSCSQPFKKENRKTSSPVRKPTDRRPSGYFVRLFSSFLLSISRVNIVLPYAALAIAPDPIFSPVCLSSGTATTRHGPNAPKTLSQRRFVYYSHCCYYLFIYFFVQSFSSVLFVISSLEFARVRFRGDGQRDDNNKYYARNSPFVRNAPLLDAAGGGGGIGRSSGGGCGVRCVLKTAF